jgi:hypothetical protein
MSATPVAGELQVVSALPAGRGRLELVCRTCGYAVLAAATPARCPLCSGSSWGLAPAARRSAEAEEAPWGRR